MNYEKFGAAISMSPEDIADEVKNHMEEIDAERVIDMIIEILGRESEEEQEVFKNAAPITKITYVAREMYCLGYMCGLYICNEALKKMFADMQARKVERANKKKAVSCIAEA